MNKLIRLPSGWINLSLVERVGQISDTELAVHFQSGQVKNCSGDDADRLREALADFSTEYLLPPTEEPELIAAIPTAYVRGKN